jgi:hypothetical protein
MLCVFPEVSELNEFEKILKNTNFNNNYDKKRAVKDYEELKKLRDTINERLPEGHADYEWLNKIPNGTLVDLFKSQELLRNIIIFMNAGIKELVEEKQE